MDKKIETFENNLFITDDDEKIICTKQNVIDMLINMRLKAKKKKDKQEIEQDIKSIEKLKLCLGDYSDSYIQKVNIAGKEAYFVYDKTKGLENNYIGIFNLKTPEFTVLYQIIDKYKLITCF